MQSRLTTDIDALLTAAANVDHARRIKAINEFPNYRIIGDGRLLNLKTGDIYQFEAKSRCSCPDYTGRIAPLRDRMRAAGAATSCCCKHWYVGRLLSGHSVQVGNSTFRAKKK